MATNLFTASTVATKKGLRVWRNPNPIRRQINTVRKLDELARLREKKWKELQDISQQILDCADQINRNVSGWKSK